MEKLLICLLVAAIALLLYFINQGKKAKQNKTGEDDPLAGLPDIIGRPKGVATNMKSDTTLSVKREKNTNGSPTTEDSDGEQNNTSTALQDDTDKLLAYWKEEEEEMGKYVPGYPDDGFATGITFDELDRVENMLEQQSLDPDEKKTTSRIVSKIDGTQLLDLLESRIGDASKKIALLLERPQVEQDSTASLPGQDTQDNFDIGDYV